MKAYVPKQKRSKKQQREENRLLRGTWDVDPVTRVKPSGKLYSRRDKHRRKEYPGGVFFCAGLGNVI